MYLSHCLTGGHRLLLLPLSQRKVKKRKNTSSPQNSNLTPKMGKIDLT